jgi:hypothetical protein
VSKKYFLHYSRIGGDQFLNIVYSFPPSNNYDDSRISQIFPVTHKPTLKLTTNITGIILYIFTDNPFTLIAKNLSDRQHINKKIFFSNGCASLVYILRDEGQVDQIIEKYKDDIKAYEFWRILKNKIKSVEFEIIPYQSIHYSKINIPPGFNHEVKKQIEEFNELISRISSLIDIYFPHQNKMITSLREKVHSLVFNLGTCFNSIQENSLESSINLRKEINIFSTQIISINSALTYYLSQSFAGTVPILENRGYMMSNSLLGIGLAINSIFSFYSFIYRQIEKDQIYTRLEEFLDEKRSINFNIFDQYPWLSDSPLLATKTRMAEMREFNNYHILYFSARWGFHEDIHSITAAIQSIDLAVIPEWNLLTLTHEYMHALTRGLLCLIKYDISCEEDEEKLNNLAKIYADSSKMENYHLLNLRTCLNLALINFCALIFAAKSFENSNLLSVDSKRIKNGGDISRILNFYDSYVNEIIAHTLDFLYFYQSDYKIYLFSLWTSWGEVPKVLNKLEHYILRSLVTISIRIKGDNDSRLQESIKLLVNELREMHKLNSNPIIAFVIKKLSNPKEHLSSNFSFEYSAYLYLADVTYHYLYSPSLPNSLSLDERIGKEENSDIWKYELNDLEFDLEGIDSPVAFAVHCLQKSKKKYKKIDYELSSVWEHVVISSTKLK